MGWLSSPDPPPAPDYAAAATAQGVANKDSAIATSNLNNPNIVNPFGTQTFTEGANPGDRPTLTQTLSPQEQALLSQSYNIKGALGDLGVTGANALKGVVGQNLDLSGAPAAPGDSTATRDKVVNAMMGRVNEDTSNSREQANSDLVAAGIHPGSKAYADKMAMIDRGYNDARQQALLAGGQEESRDFGIDTQRRKDAIAEILTQRQTPLNEINALMSGSQVSNPFALPGYANNTNIAPPPVFGATDAAGNYAADIYNAKAGGAAGMNQGLFGLGAAGINKYSDRRLKTDITQVGQLPNGLNLYSFRYLWSNAIEIGVMADEVEKIIPEAVSTVNGYQMVDYSRL